jgi:hypothetical protein
MSWGGRRAGAGRPKTGRVASERHRTRPVLSPRHPVRVTLRTRIRGLHRRAAYRAIRRAVATSLARTDFRIVQLVARDARLELLVEADDRHALARGLQGFQVACARQLNRANRRSGCVFPDRYRAVILRTRSEVRRAASELASPPVTYPETWLLRRLIKPDRRLSLPDRKLPP